MKNTICIACGVFKSDLEKLLKSELYSMDVDYLPGGLHSEPDQLRKQLQERIDKASEKYRKIIVLYGLCGRGIVGLKSQTATLVLPKAHDCISLFLGGPQEYKKQFAHAPGTYYISAGWYEEQVQPKGKTIKYPDEYFDTDNLRHLEQRYGVDNAGEIRGFLDSWKTNYTRAVYIETGADEEEKYESHARNLAEENHWEFLKLKGSQRMIVQCLEAVETSDSVLMVPPEHELYHDTGTGTVNSALLGSSASLDRNETIIIDSAGPKDKAAEPTRRRGLGIDAGGTYTDAVIFDFQSRRVLAKSKALTTKWKYSEGIMNAVNSLPGELRSMVDIVSVSTTLVTNAIVESNRRPVGLLLMPNGNEAPPDLKHQPLGILSGRMSIGGDITEKVDAGEVRSTVRHMISHFHVEAFAVSGYGGVVNPELELQVKEIVREETALEVCCGHELSGNLNFSVRAVTAVLNAGVMPIMEDFLREMELSISDAGIRAPLLVVRGDGAVMSEGYAREFPVQTALSGPAASMAGAMYLIGSADAVVLDVGGTTSDIGFLEEGRVAICENGARIGEWDTHIKAVDMLTSGLGGDSEVLFERQSWTLGPKRVTPVCCLGSDPDTRESLTSSIQAAGNTPADWVESTIPLQFLYRSGKAPDFPLTSREQAIYDALEETPLMIWQIKERIGAGSWWMVKSGRLESSYCLQRAGLTPTDLFHCEDLLELWDRETAELYLSVVATSAGLNTKQLGKIIRQSISDKLGNSFLRKMLGDEISRGSGARDILRHGNPMIRLKPEIRVPVIGLGAPAGLMLTELIQHLGGELRLCENGDVANAVGAITSKVTITRSARVAATSAGGYRIYGLESEDRHYETLEDAEEICLQSLTELTRFHGRKAGTSADKVEITIRSKVARTGEGSELFIERLYSALLSGTPDLVQL